MSEPRPAPAHARPAPHPPGAGLPTAPVVLALPTAQGPPDAPAPVAAHGCWYPSADPTGERIAFICNRNGVPQLWVGPPQGEARLLDAGPDPVTEVSWSPDGRWIAYTTAPGGSERTQVLGIRPDGTGRRLLAGGEPDATAYLGHWTRDGSAVAVTTTVVLPAPDGSRAPADASLSPAEPTASRHDGKALFGPAPQPGRAERAGERLLLGGAHRRLGGPHPAVPVTGTVADDAVLDGGTAPTHPVPRLSTPPPDVPLEVILEPPFGRAPGTAGLAAYLVDPDGARPAVLLATEAAAATLRVCDATADGRLLLLRRGPRGRREAVVLRTADLVAVCTVPTADGDPWIGKFSPDGRALYLRSNADREFAALLRAELEADGACHHLAVTAERDGADLELLSVSDDGRTAALVWNEHGRSELQTIDLARSDTGKRPQPVALPHEVLTRIAPAGPDGLVLALSGSVRRPGVWTRFPDAPPVRTGWSSRDEDAVPPGARPPVRPEPLHAPARDALILGGWYYRAPERHPHRPGPCVIHLHGGPEEQERPVFDPLYHELLGRGLDVYAPDVRGSLGAGRSFVDADLGAGRFAAIDDVAACAAHAVVTGLADPLRLAVMGHSYGGYLTLASLVWHPELFRTGVAVCGISDFETFFASTEPWIAQSAAAKYGHPDRDRELLHALSPMSRVDALRAPVLAVHGEHDTNVPPTESEQFVRAGRRRGIEARMLILPEEGHVFLREGNRVLFRRTAADWMQRHLAS